MPFNPNTDISTPWRTIVDAQGFTGAASAQGTYLIGFDAGAGVAAAGGASTGLLAFYFDPADYKIAARQLTIRLRGMLLTNAVAPGASTVFTFGLYPVATFGGASSALATIATLSAATLTCPAINAPAATSQSHSEATAINAPVAGWYALAFALSGASAAAGAVEVVRAQLQVQ